MRIKYIYIILGVIFLLSYADVVRAQQSESHSIEFRSGNDIIYEHHGSNFKDIAAIKELIAHYEDVILTGNGHLRLVASVGVDGAKDPVAMNLAALRAAVVRNYLKTKFRMLTNWSFTFYFDNTRVGDNSIEVSYVPHAISAKVSSVIHYTREQSNLPVIKETLARYGKLPYLGDALVLEDDEAVRAAFDRINALATNPVDVEPRGEDGSSPEKLLIAIHYRWDKYNLDSVYLSNPENLHLLDSILNSDNSRYIDTLTIVSYASPEGHPDYNQRLSERRAKTIKDYIIGRYKAISPERIVTRARGENWQGLRKFVVNDPALPSRDKVLQIIDSSLPDIQKQDFLTKLNGGTTYYRYILPNYYRYLRNGSSVLINYTRTPVAAVIDEPRPMLETRLEPLLVPLFFMTNPQPVVRYPIALKTNLLFDAVGAPNIGIEVPIGMHFSVVGDFAYAYWRSPKNLYALQTLEGGVEGRYWFGVSDRKKQKNAEWAKPLRGWNVGLYAMYCSRYDVQWIDGYQGDGFWSAGLTAGYATPVGRNLTLEFSLAAGYFYTKEYRHYHQPEYDKNGKYHLMWQQTGSLGTFSLTKARVSLVWLIPNRQKGGLK